MPYSDIVPDLLDALALGAGAEPRVLRAVKRNVRYLLRNYNFPKSLVHYTTLALAIDIVSIALPAGAGKVRAVRLLDDYSDPTGVPLYKVLRRREVTLVRSIDGPNEYMLEGSTLLLDTPLPEAGPKVEIWYQTTDPDAVETWMAEEFHDVLFHRTGYELSPLEGKPETQQVFQPLWADDQLVLAKYLNELEFEGMDIQALPRRSGFVERYASGN